MYSSFLGLASMVSRKGVLMAPGSSVLTCGAGDKGEAAGVRSACAVPPAAFLPECCSRAAQLLAALDGPHPPTPPTWMLSLPHADASERASGSSAPLLAA